MLSLPSNVVGGKPSVQSLESFLAEIADADCEFLSLKELDRFPAVCCGMANGDGGWVVLGVSADEEREIEGVGDAAQLERRLGITLRDSREISVDPVLSFRPLMGNGKNLLAVKTGPVEWWRRPVCVGGSYVHGTCRRVEGANVLSGHDMRLRMALDALENLRDDLTVPGLSAGDLSAEDVAAFREVTVSRLPLWTGLSEEGFLKRALVLDGADGVTLAGRLLLGEGDPVVRAHLKNTQETLEYRNLWSACRDLLPRLCESVSESCAEAVRECFINALLHAEYDAGCVEIELDGPTLRLSNPGLPRTRVPGESVTRNHRLMRMFQMAGLSHGSGKGLEIIGKFDEGFRLRVDSLELSTTAELLREFVELPATPEIVAPPEAVIVDEPTPPEPELPVIRDFGWMPVVGETSSYNDLSSSGLPVISEFSPTVIVASADEDTAEAPEPEDPEPTVDVTETAEVTDIEATDITEEKPSEPEQPKPYAFGNAAHELEEYISALKNTSPAAETEEPETEKCVAEEETKDMSEPEDEGVPSDLIRMVRETPRVSPALVRNAILELCREYRSFAELATLLSRSEKSLRRHYITAMVQEGLLEMEFPDRVGHPEQRYRIPQE